MKEEPPLSLISRDSKTVGRHLFKRAELEDVLLLECIAGGDQQAMAAIYDRYSPLVYSVAFKVLKVSEEAEDVMQDVLIQVWRSPFRFVSEKGSLAAWLAVVARRRAIDAFRRRRPVQSLENVVLFSKSNVAGEGQHNLQLGRVRAIMSTLPAAQQEVLELAYFHGLSHTEIANTTGEPLGTVKTRLRLGLKSVKNHRSLQGGFVTLRQAARWPDTFSWPTASSRLPLEPIPIPRTT